MKCLALVTALALATLAAQAAPRFVELAVYIDSDQPLAAWQFEFTEMRGRVEIVGIENGGHQAYTRTPYYDANALASGVTRRIVVADYSLRPPGELPVGRTRVATLHVMVREMDPEYVVTLVSATNSDGRAIDASISLHR